MKQPIFISLLSFMILGLSATASSIQEVSTKYEFEGTYFAPEDLDVKPVPIEQKLPRLSDAYPKGYAIVSFLISDEGLPQQIQVLEATDKSFLRSAKRIVKHWRFEPGKVNGSSVACAQAVVLQYHRNLNYVERRRLRNYDSVRLASLPSYGERREAVSRR